MRKSLKSINNKYFKYYFIVFTCIQLSIYSIIIFLYLINKLYLSLFNNLSYFISLYIFNILLYSYCIGLSVYSILSA